MPALWTGERLIGRATSADVPCEWCGVPLSAREGRPVWEPPEADSDAVAEHGRHCRVHIVMCRECIEAYASLATAGMVDIWEWRPRSGG